MNKLKIELYKSLLLEFKQLEFESIENFLDESDKLLQIFYDNNDNKFRKIKPTLFAANNDVKEKSSLAIMVIIEENKNANLKSMQKNLNIIISNYKMDDTDINNCLIYHLNFKPFNKVEIFLRRLLKNVY